VSPDHPDNLRLRVIVSCALILLVLLVGAGAFAGLASLSKDPEKAARKAPRTVVRVVLATRGEYLEMLRGYGRARALRRADVSAEVPGVISRISDALEAGSAVTAGEELVRLDDRDYQTALAAATARRAQTLAAVDGLAVGAKSTKRRLDLAKKDLSAAEREFERVRELAEDEVVTQSELDRQRITKSRTEKEVVSLEAQLEATEKDLVRANAEVDAAGAALDRAELDLQRTTVRAPFAGRVVERRISPGARVAAGGVLFTLVDLSRVEVPIALGASRYGEAKAGSAASIRFREAGETAWTGTVARISPTVDDRDRTFSAFLVIEGTPLSNPVPPGTFVLAEIEGRRFDNVMAIPRVAFVGKRVYLAAGDATDEATVTSREPEVLRMMPSIALVTGGLEVGERVIVTSLEQIAVGATVRVVAEEKVE